MQKISGNKLRQLELLIGIMLSLFLLIVVACFATGSFKSPGAIFFSLVIGLCGVYLIYKALFGKEKLPLDLYNQLKGAQLFGTFNRTCGQYEKDITDEKDLIMYKEFENAFHGYFNGLASGVLNQPLQYRKPMSAKEAAYAGTLLGGVAVGVAAAAEAERKRQEYEQNARDVIKSKIEVGSAYDRTEKCYNEMVSILRKYPKAGDDWSSKEKEIMDKLNHEYEIK